MKKRIVTLTIALIMLIGMQVFATTGLPLTPNNGQSGVGTGTGSTSNPTASGTITPNPTSGNGSNTSTGTGTSSTNPTTSTGNNESNTASTKKPETSLPKAGTSNVVLYGVSVLSVVAIVLYRKITK